MFRNAAHQHDIGQRLDDTKAIDSAGDTDRQAFSCEPEACLAYRSAEAVKAEQTDPSSARNNRDSSWFSFSETVNHKSASNGIFFMGPDPRTLCARHSRSSVRN